MIRLKALLVLTVLLVPLSAVSGMQAAQAATPGYNVYVGYADTLRSSPTNFPTPFDTGAGVTNEGQPSSTSLDSGAIRVINASGVAETVDSVTVNIGTHSFDLWPHGISLPFGGQLVFGQTVAFNFDTSDFGNGTCTDDGVMPTVTVSVNGTPTTYTDSGQVLNTGGVDGAVCAHGGFPAGNESAQWTSIGSPPCPTGAALTLAPASQTRAVMSTATVTANLSACGTALQGATVSFLVISGPNAGKTGSGVADASGNASFIYTSSLPGTDTLQASVTNAAGTITSGSVTVTWTVPFPSGGSFVVGDVVPGTVTGTSVSFWGAQWATNNTLSGGAAPASFKGWEDSAIEPTCSTTWTTDPGNSAPPPPGPLPSFMGVIVSSSISQSGSAISGNVVHIIIVKTNPGYAPDPGHPGTGTIVGSVC
jgi:hypothetical protein